MGRGGCAWRPDYTLKRGRALVIGNAKYTSRDYQVSTTAASNAEYVYDALGSERSVFKSRRSLQQDLKCDQMSEHIKHFCSDDEGEQCTWLHYTGHAIVKNCELYLVPVDAQHGDDKGDRIPFIPLSEVVNMLYTGSTDCLHVITLDCCVPDKVAICPPRRRNQRAHSSELIVFAAVTPGSECDDEGFFSQALAHWLRHVHQEAKPGIYPHHMQYEVTARVRELADSRGPGCATRRGDVQEPSLLFSTNGFRRHLALDSRKRQLTSVPRPLRVHQLPILIVCEGLIGCGKTTFLNYLASAGSKDLDLIREPVAESENNTWWHKLIGLYHAIKTSKARPHPDALDLEQTVWEHHKHIATSRVANTISERGLESAAKVFSKSLYDGKLLSEADYMNFQYDLNNISADPDYRPTVILYFRIDVQTAKERIEKRVNDEGRYFEKAMDVKYLESLHAQYEALYGNREDSNVIVVKADETPEDMLQALLPKLAKYLTEAARQRPHLCGHVDKLLRCLDVAAGRGPEGNGPCPSSPTAESP